MITYRDNTGMKYKSLGDQFLYDQLKKCYGTDGTDKLIFKRMIKLIRSGTLDMKNPRRQILIMLLSEYDEEKQEEERLNEEINRLSRMCKGILGEYVTEKLEYIKITYIGSKSVFEISIVDKETLKNEILNIKGMSPRLHLVSFQKPDLARIERPRCVVCKKEICACSWLIILSHGRSSGNILFRRVMHRHCYNLYNDIVHERPRLLRLLKDDITKYLRVHRITELKYSPNDVAMDGMSHTQHQNILDECMLSTEFTLQLSKVRTIIDLISEKVRNMIGIEIGLHDDLIFDDTSYIQNELCRLRVGFFYLRFFIDEEKEFVYYIDEKQAIENRVKKKSVSKSDIQLLMDQCKEDEVVVE